MTQWITQSGYKEHESIMEQAQTLDGYAIALRLVWKSHSSLQGICS